jgi:hypothetical protein
MFLFPLADTIGALDKRVQNMNHHKRDDLLRCSLGGVVLACASLCAQEKQQAENRAGAGKLLTAVHKHCELLA